MMTKISRRSLILFLVLQTLLFGILQLQEPSAKLYWSWPHLLHWGVWFMFVRSGRPWSWWWPRWAFALAGTQLVFLFSHYALYKSASLTYLAGSFIPLLVWGAIRFAFWNWQNLHNPQAVRALGLSALGWGLMAAAYPPLPLGPGGLIFLVPWFLVLWRNSMREALFATFWSGFLFNAFSYYWIYNVVKVGPGPVIMLGLFLLISYFSAYNALAGWIFVRCRDLRWRGIPLLTILFPVFWAALESTRTRGDFSFPWSPVGLIFGNHVEWLQGLSLVGVFGYSTLVIVANMIMAYALLKKRWILTGVPLLLFALLWGYGSWTLSAPQAQPFHVAPGTDSLRVAMIQPSIHQTKKWSRAYYDTVMTKTWNLVGTLNPAELDLVVLPETALPDFIKMRRSEQKRLHNFVQESGVPILIGALDYERNGPPPRKYSYYNSAFYFDTSAKMHRYSKINLVPFSERLPFDDVFPLLNYVDLGEGDFTPGDTLPVFTPGHWTPMICYEAIYGDLMRQAVRNGSRLIVNITNDGWFGRSTAPGQHLNLVRYRAVETGVPVARNANSGISAFIDARGHFLGNTELFTEAIIRATLPLERVPTLYYRIGDLVEKALFIFFFIFLIVLAIWNHQVRKRD